MPLLRRPFVAPRVWVAGTALDQLAREANQQAPMETGGLLLGYWGKQPGVGEVLIESVIGPGPKARHERTRFCPDAVWQREQLADVYASSGRISTYLGDWHTHPGGVPVPSRQDRKTARAIAEAEDARAPRPLMLILGGGADTSCWTPRLHVLDRGRLKTVTMHRLGASTSP